jgi:hypothetical protein
MRSAWSAYCRQHHSHIVRLSDGSSAIRTGPFKNPDLTIVASVWGRGSSSEGTAVSVDDPRPLQSARASSKRAAPAEQISRPFSDSRTPKPTLASPVTLVDRAPVPERRMSLDGQSALSSTLSGVSSVSPSGGSRTARSARLASSSTHVDGTRVDALEAKMGALAEQISGLDIRLEGPVTSSPSAGASMPARLSALEKAFDSMQQRVHALQAQDRANRDSLSIVNRHITNIHGRIDMLTDHMFPPSSDAHYT